jgi:hypothetical protein
LLALKIRRRLLGHAVGDLFLLDGQSDRLHDELSHFERYLDT